MLYYTVLAMGAPQGAGGQPAGAGDLFSVFIPFILIFVIFYFLLFLPQKKKAKEHRELLENLKKGDKVITTGGIYGLVESVGKTTVVLKIGENIKVKFGKAYITTVRSTAEDD
ncbi:YajC [Candidatus Magnetoovum chiemensis]|nr:YajC [Candidatus Magnetoovum chiemensis]